VYSYNEKNVVNENLNHIQKPYHNTCNSHNYQFAGKGTEYISLQIAIKLGLLKKKKSLDVFCQVRNRKTETARTVTFLYRIYSQSFYT
jgi:hypothetical protein